MKPLVKRLLSSSFVGALASPLSVDDYLGLIDRRMSLSQPRGRVVHATRQTPDSVTLAIEPNDNWAGHRPGQHVLLGADLDGVRHSRCFSPVSAPDDPLLEITVKRNGEGRVSNFLVDHAERGQPIHLSPAEGDFYPATTPPDRALLISAGSGITPVLSILRHWAGRGQVADVCFVNYARRRADMMYVDELEAMAERHAGLPVVKVFTGEHGRRLDRESLATIVPDLESCTTWLCGPSGFMDTAQALIETRSARAAGP